MSIGQTLKHIGGVEAWLNPIEKLQHFGILIPGGDAPSAEVFLRLLASSMTHAQFHKMIRALYNEFSRTLSADKSSAI